MSDDVPHLADFRWPDDLPSANSVKVYRCNSTTHVHLVLLDEEGYPIAQATLGRRNLDIINAAAEVVLSHVANVVPIR